MSEAPRGPPWASLSTPLRGALIGAFVVCVGAFLWWAVVVDEFMAGQAVVAEFVIVLLAGVPALVLATLCRRRWMTIACAVAGVAVIALILTAWSPRKRFVRDLYSVQPGMTVDEVEAVMGRYMRGFGKKTVLPPGPPPVVRSRPLSNEAEEEMRAEIAAAQAAYVEPVYPGGEERAHVTGTMTYRWNDTDGAYDFDLGQVKFNDGRVVDVEFLPD